MENARSTKVKAAGNRNGCGGEEARFVTRLNAVIWVRGASHNLLPEFRLDGTPLHKGLHAVGGQHT